VRECSQFTPKSYKESFSHRGYGDTLIVGDDLSDKHLRVFFTIKFLVTRAYRRGPPSDFTV
jgi:hypothetical protein